MDKAVAETSGRPRKRWWIPLLVLSLAGAAAAALIASKPKPEPVEITERAWLVATQPAARRRFSPSVTLYGRLESLWSSRLTAGIAADVVAVEVIDGDDITRGQLLARLDDRDARLQLAQRAAELKQAEARIEAEMSRHAADLRALPRERRLTALAKDEVIRLKGLVKKQVSAQTQLDTARQALENQSIALSAREQTIDAHAARLAEVEAARDRARALRDQARLELDRTRISAPFNGRVSDVSVSPGKRVRIGDALVEIYDTDAMIVRAQIPNRYLVAVRAARERDLPLEVRGDIDGIAVVGRLRSLSGEVADAAGGIDGLFELNGEASRFSQGRFVELRLALPPEDGLIALPHEAMYGTGRVYTIDAENRMRPVSVDRVGEWRDADGNALVLIRSEALGEGDTIVTTQLPNALDGLLVERVRRD